VLLLPVHSDVGGCGETDPRAGAVCGKLLSIGPGFQLLPEARIDSTESFLLPQCVTSTRLHQSDTQCFESTSMCSAASAAAALFRREMIDDIAVEGSFFDPDFFVYRETRRGLRAQLLGWRCIYTPAAVAYHVRTVTLQPSLVSPAINMHSVKNRFLMRIKNVTPVLPQVLAPDDSAGFGGCRGQVYFGTTSLPLSGARRLYAPRFPAAAFDHGP